MSLQFFIEIYFSIDEEPLFVLSELSKVTRQRQSTDRGGRVGMHIWINIG